MRSLMNHVLLLGNQGAAPAPTPLLTDLVAYWSLEEASGTRADSHGEFDLTDNNTVTQTTGKVGNAAQFTAANSESLTHADHVDLRAGARSFTFAGWVYLTPTGSHTFVAKLTAFSATGMEYQITATNLGVSMYVGNGTTTKTVTKALAMSNAWVFVTVWYDHAAGTINVDLNNSGTAGSTAVAGTIPTTAAAFQMGARTTGEYMNGLIDEVGRWNRVLTADERTWLYNSGDGRSYAEIAAFTGP